MEDIKKLLVYFRNSLAFSYAWLVFSCALTGYLFSNTGVTFEFLLKVLALCAWGSACFVFAFFTKIMKKRGFIFSLTIFFLLFVPVEILMFYWMNIFSGAGTIRLWSILGIIIVAFYVISILIDLLVMRKPATTDAAKLMEYNSRSTS